MNNIIISDSIKYIGVDDTTLDLFESQYIVPNGVSYNSYLILDEKANLNKEQDKISKNISFKVPFLRLGESSPIYKMNPYLIYKKNRVIIKINICQITHEKDGMRIISSGTFVLYYRIKGVSYKLIKIENRGI